VTYPDLYVATILNEYFIPVQVNVAGAKDLLKKFMVIWTPNLNILDADANLIYHTEGFLPPSEYAAMLMVAMAHFHLRKKRYKEALSFYQEVWDKQPHSTFAPEALYYVGVSRYMDSHQVDALVESWKMLQKGYPGSTWAVRSSIV
jgi:hypothetical protein